MNSFVDEYIDVLQRLGLGDEQELEELLRLFATGFHNIFTTKTPQLHLVEEDPDDDKFIECAVALKAQFVISGDRALVAVKNYMGIKIVTPKEFIDLSRKYLVGYDMVLMVVPALRPARDGFISVVGNTSMHFTAVNLTDS